MEYIDDLRLVPTFVPATWVVQKNMLFDLDGFSPAALNPDDRLFYDQEIFGASSLFMATSDLMVDAVNYRAWCCLGGDGARGDGIRGYDYQFKVTRGRKRTVFNDDGDVTGDIYEAARLATAFMFTWLWHPERIISGDYSVS